MPFAIPLIAKVLASLASSDTSAPAAAPKTDSSKATSAANFTQTIDDVSRTAATGAQHGTHGASRG